MKQELQKLIAQGRTDAAIEILLRVTRGIEDDELHSEVILHANRYSEYLKDKRLGVLSPKERQRELAQVNQSLLFIIGQLPDGLEISLSAKGKEASFPASRRRFPSGWVMIGVIAIMLVLAFGVWMAFEGGKQPAKAEPSGPGVAVETDTTEEDTGGREDPPSVPGREGQEEKAAPPPPDTAEIKKRQEENILETLRGESVAIEAGPESGLSPFSIGKHEVTIGQYLLFCRETGRNFPPEIKDTTQKRRPITFVSWYDAVEYCKYAGGRLPTVTQWEYAATGGVESQSYEFSGGNDVKRAGWSAADGVSTPQPVGRKAANELGLYDMSGNVREWCRDEAPDNKKYRLVKGGAWKSYASMLNPRKKTRPEPAGARDDMTGFRVVFDQ